MYQKSIALIFVLSVTAGMFLTTAPPEGVALAQGLKTRLPDLVVGIEAAENQDRSMPISNGANLAYSGGGPANWFWFTIRNQGITAANNFTYKMIVEDNGIKIYDPPVGKLTLAGNGGSQEFGPVRLNLFNRNTIKVVIVANYGGVVKELTMSNNVATLEYTAEVVQ